jgi:predicted flap endonuclease-1-like 5' DNA nuclease
MAKSPRVQSIKPVKRGRSTRPPRLTRESGGEAALSELRGLGPASATMLVSVGIHSAAQLRKADLFTVYAKVKQQHPRASINLLYIE